MTEAVSQLYRGLAPIHPWLIYLLEAYTGYEKVSYLLNMSFYTPNSKIQNTVVEHLLKL